MGMSVRASFVSKRLGHAGHEIPYSATTILEDVALGKRTLQSSMHPDAPRNMGEFMVPTVLEARPFFQIDLGENFFLAWVAVWVLTPTLGASLRISTMFHPTPSGDVPAGCAQTTVRLAPARAGDVQCLGLPVGQVGRFLRIELESSNGLVSLALSAVECLATPLLSRDLAATWQRTFSLFWERPLIAERTGGGAFILQRTYGEVYEAANALASSLADLLAKPPEEQVAVALCLPNCTEWIVGDLAITLRGHISVALAPTEPPTRLATMLARTKARCLVCDASTALALASHKAALPDLTLVIVRGSDEQVDASMLTPISVVTLAAALEHGAKKGPLPPVHRGDNDTYSVLFTSGSSGVPKGALRSYGRFLGMLRTYGVVQPARHLSFQPLSHLSERMFLPAVMMHGGVIAFSAGGTEIPDDLRAFEPTMLSSVPRLFEWLYARYFAHREQLHGQEGLPEVEADARALASCRGAFGRRLQTVSVGSAPCSSEVLEFIRRCFSDVWVAEGYGTTECGTIALDGIVRGHVELKLRSGTPNAAAGRDVERGEIWVRTPHMIDGYLGDSGPDMNSLDEDGYFPTGDLGERTPDGRVRVVGRISATVKRSSGEFVAPDRVEAALASAKGVDHIYVHGEDAASRLCAVVVPKPETSADKPDGKEGALDPREEDVWLARLRAFGARCGLAAHELPQRIHISREAFSTANGLLTQSGKLARAACKAKFASVWALSAHESATIPRGTDTVGELARVASSVLRRPISPETPTDEDHGVDSLSVAELLSAFQIQLGIDVPPGLWYASRNLSELAHVLEGGSVPTGSAAALAHVDRARPIPYPRHAAASSGHGNVILLTGSTGFLGAHLVSPLLLESPDARIVALVRAESEASAEARLRATLLSYDLPWPEAQISVVAADLSKPRLNLGEARWQKLADEASCIVHAGAEVNWVSPYARLRGPNVVGTDEILDLAMAGREKSFHFISTISTAPADGDERTFLPFDVVSQSSGYALSKWIAEERVRSALSQGLAGAVYRPSMISGNTRTGRMNPSDYLARYLLSCLHHRCYLDRDDEVIDMTPVDFVATGIAALMRHARPAGRTFHLTNISGSPSYAALGRALCVAGLPLRPCDYASFRRTVLADRRSPLFPLASFFPESGFALHMGPWPSAASRSVLEARGVRPPPIDAAYAMRCLRSLAGPAQLDNLATGESGDAGSARAFFSDSPDETQRRVPTPVGPQSEEPNAWLRAQIRAARADAALPRYFQLMCGDSFVDSEYLAEAGEIAGTDCLESLDRTALDWLVQRGDERSAAVVAAWFSGYWSSSRTPPLLGDVLLLLEQGARSTWTGHACRLGLLAAGGALRRQDTNWPTRIEIRDAMRHVMSTTTCLVEFPQVAQRIERALAFGDLPVCPATPRAIGATGQAEEQALSVVLTLIASRPMTAAKVEGIAGAKLSPSPRSNQYFQVLEGMGAPTSPIESVEGRFPEPMAGKADGILLLTLRQWVHLTESWIVEQLGQLYEIHHPMPEASLAVGPTIAFPQPWGELRFQFGPEPDANVRTIVIDGTSPITRAPKPTS